MPDQIARCPYCRPGEPMLCSAPLPTKEPRMGYYVGCQKCLARGPQALYERKAVAGWNEVALFMAALIGKGGAR